MSIRQATLGAFVAATLMFGADATPDGRGGAAELNLHSGPDTVSAALAFAGSLFASHRAEAGLELFRNCRDEVLDQALDAVGEVSARLKHI